MSNASHHNAATAAAMRSPLRWVQTLVMLAGILLGPAVLAVSFWYFYNTTPDIFTHETVSARFNRDPTDPIPALTNTTRGLPVIDTFSVITNAATQELPEKVPALSTPEQQIFVKEQTNTAEITALLQKARTAFENNALTTPRENNAMKWSQAILKLDPDNKEIHRLLNAVIDTYLRWTLHNLERNRLNKGSLFWDRLQLLLDYADKDQLAAIQALGDILRAKRRQAD